MLKDSYNRKHTYLRVSVTDRCNLKCTYCMPEEGFCQLAHEDVLRNEEFLTLISIFHSLGINKVRFTGGEPLVRKGVMDLIEETAKEMPKLELALTTNGVNLGQHLERLKKTGMKKLNISLDTLNRERFNTVTGRDFLDQVLASIDKALAMDFFDIKINIVLMEETLGELKDFLSYFKDQDMALRFIEMMPELSNKPSSEYVPSSRLEEKLHELGELTRVSHMDTQVATMYTLVHNHREYKIGIIPPISHSFCGKCNRLRLTADGQLKSCLYSNEEYNLKDLLRKDASREEIVKHITEAVLAKGREKVRNQSKDRTMSKIGG
jgi:GTP 3',8-cyclase